MLSAIRQGICRQVAPASVARRACLPAFTWTHSMRKMAEAKEELQDLCHPQINELQAPCTRALRECATATGTVPRQPLDPPILDHGAAA